MVGFKSIKTFFHLKSKIILGECNLDIVQNYTVLHFGRQYEIGPHF